MSGSRSFLPHRIPFLAASTIERVGDGRARGTYLCSAADGLEGSPRELMLVEAMAQVGGSIVFRDSGERAYLSGIDGVALDGAIAEGDRIDLDVELEAELPGLYQFRATGIRDGVAIARARFVLASAGRAETTQMEP